MSRRAASVVLCMMLGGILAPGAAIAAFLDQAQAAADYTAASLQPPGGPQTQIIMDCTQPATRTITVKKYGRVLKANFHELKIYVDSGPSPVYTGGLQESGQTVVTVPYMPGAWRAEIRGQYLVPNSTNVWTSLPLTRAVTCP